MSWLIRFNRWWDKYGGNTHMSDLEAAYHAGWVAAKRKYK